MKSSRKPLSLLFLLLLISFGCSEESENPVTTNDVTGQELFSAIFFGHNSHYNFSLSKQLQGKKRDLPQNLKEEVRKREDFLLSSIHALDPTFYDNFKSKIQSNNHLVVGEGLQDASSTIARTLSETPELAMEYKYGASILSQVDINKFIEGDVFNEAAFENYLIENNPNPIVTPTVVVAAVAIYIAVVLDVVMYVNIGVYFNVSIGANFWVEDAGATNLGVQISPNVGVQTPNVGVQFPPNIGPPPNVFVGRYNSNQNANSLKFDMLIDEIATLSWGK
ncbi:MAG: hypothetical protein ABJG47_14055 [Ekhidna sp.]